MWKLAVYLTGLLAILTGSLQTGSAQQISRDDYLQYLPLFQPSIVEQTAASRDLQLYGDRSDPAYRDEAPRDGIDDRRLPRLKALCEMFSPILFKNTSHSLPLDFKVFTHASETALLYIDSWDLSTARPHIRESKTLKFFRPNQPPASQPTASLTLPDYNALLEDQKLSQVLHDFHPDSHRSAKTPAEGCSFTVMYFDFPGENEKSWKKVYQNLITGDLPRRYKPFVKVYAHPFIHREWSAKSPAQYELVIQYWFFYPFNDGGNNHEGDWEHLNVVIAHRDRPADLFTREDIWSVLHQRGYRADDEKLVIKRVEYFFHHYVMILDYSRPNVYLKYQEAWQEEMRKLGKDRIGEKWIWETTRARLFSANSPFFRHPIAYIGGDNKGWDQIIALPGGKNRDSHGTYPFPGIYKGIGPVGATESINGKLDLASALEDTTKLVHFRGAQIEVVPDWECLADLVLQDQAVRQEWSWLILPIRWGYPASKSPAAGIVRHADTGNLGPVGPAYNSGWNRVKNCLGYELYHPHKFSSIMPIGWQDNFYNSWGFLNFTWPTLVSFPPFDAFWRGPLALIRKWVFDEEIKPLFFPQDIVPFRRMSFGLGWRPTAGNKHFAELLFRDDEVKRYLADHQLSGIPASLDHLATFSLRNIGFELNYYVGRMFVSENLLRYSRSEVRSALRNEALPGTGGDGVPLYLQGELQMWEYAGSIRYNLLPGQLQPFLKGGYGYSWYRVENLQAGDRFLGETNWFNEPRLWPPKWWLPNTLHVGIGLEFLPVINYAEHRWWPPLPWNWRLKSPDLGIKLEYNLYFHRLDNGSDHTVSIRRGEFAVTMTLSF